MRRSALLVLLPLLAAGPAAARDWFDFSRQEAVERMRAAVERIDAVAPIPPLRCRPRPAILRTCYTEVAAGLTLEITTNAGVDPHTATQAAYEAFKADENAGKVYEIELRIAGRGERLDATADMFDVLCRAMILAVRPNLGVRAATSRFHTYLRRSVNKAATGDGEVRLVGNPDTLIIDSWNDGSAYCKVSAEDDHRLPR